MTFSQEIIDQFYDLSDRLERAGMIEVFVPNEHCVYMNTSSGPSSQPGPEIFNWLEKRGLRHGNWIAGCWTDNWPQIDDPDPRVKITFNISDAATAMLFKLTFS